MLTHHAMTEDEKYVIADWRYSGDYALYNTRPYEEDRKKGVGFAHPGFIGFSFYGRDALIGFTCLYEEDREIMKSHGAFVIHNPSSNLKLGSGIAPIAAFLGSGVNVALGTDGASSNNNLNMMEEMHMAAMICRGSTGDANAVEAGAILCMATRSGALAQGRTDCGLIREGFRADLIVIDLDKPHLRPDFDTLANVVFSAQSSDICLNMVDGRVIYRDGECVFMDRERVIYEAEASFGRILGEL